MSDSTQITTRPRASAQLATLIGMEPGAMLDAIKAQCFRTMRPENVTNEQLAAFVSIAAEMGVNPFLPDMLYAFPGSNGSIIPIMGPSGVYKKLMEHPDVDSWETEVFPADVSVPPTHAVTKIWRKGKERPLSYTALVSEWKMNSNPNWATRTRHMIGLRSLKHAARQIIHGLPYDADDREIMNEINVTPETTAEPTPPRPAPPPRAKKGAAAVVENPHAGGKTGVVVEGDFTEGAKAPSKAKQETDASAVDIGHPSMAGDRPLPEQKPATITHPQPADKPAGNKNAQTGEQATPERTPEQQKILDDLRAKQGAAKKVLAEKAVQPDGPAILKDGETITVTATIAEFTAMDGKIDGKPTPLVQAQLKDGFTGLVMHFGGGTGVAPNIAPDPLYKVGGRAKFTLRGRVNKKTGNVMNLVDKVEAASGDVVEMS